MDEDYKIVQQARVNEADFKAREGFNYGDENFVSKHTLALFVIGGIFLLATLAGDVIGVYFFWVAICTYLVYCFVNQKIGPWMSRGGGRSNAVVIIGKRARGYSAIFLMTFILMFILFFTNILNLFYVPAEQLEVHINIIRFIISIPLGYLYGYWFFRVNREDQNLSVKNYGARVIGKE